MPSATRKIEIDEYTAFVLEERAAGEGLSVAQLVNRLVEEQTSTFVFSDKERAELDAQWAAIESGEEKTVPHAEVARWLKTWGTPEFKPWPES